MFTIFDNVKDARSWQSSIGISECEFKELLVAFESCYKNIHSLYKINERCKLNSYSKRLFFVLFYLKNYPTIDILAMSFGLDRNSAHLQLKKMMIILKATLKQYSVLPIQEFLSRREFDETILGEEEIYIDATERPVERSQNADKQRERFSGKKKAYDKE